MKIYTKTGDDGTTGLQGGTRLPKSSQRIVAYGMIDEINSIMGIILSHKTDDDILTIFSRIQNELFVVGSDLSNPNLDEKGVRVSKKMIDDLEQDIDKFEAELPPLTNFILPGGEHVAALIHFCRTVTRRAETQIVALEEDQKINPYCRMYLNRLSDLLFVLGRTVNKRNNTADVIWNP